MSDEGERTCPLCAEEMDLTDQQLKPCKCGYEICVWCWHHILNMAEKDESEGRCPACRSPYDKEKIVGMAANCERLVTDSMDRKKSQKAKTKTSEGRKQLTSVRVIQRNLVYIVGLPLDLADEDLLQRKEYFGQYGKVLKVSMSRTAAGVIQQFPNNTCSVYITYSKEEEAIRCIQSVHGFVLDGRSLKACFGTTKYCHAWLRNVPCTNPDCLYLHEIGSHEDSFTKDEIISAYTRSRVQLTVGTNNMARRSGNVLPPPLDDYCISNSASAAKPIGKNTSNSTISNGRSSPPNGSSGRSIALPPAASWAMRASCQSQSASSICSNGSIKSKPDNAGVTSAFSPVLESRTKASMLHNNVEKESTQDEVSQNHNCKDKPDFVKPKRQITGADSQASLPDKHSTDDATTTVNLNDQSFFPPSSKDIDSGSNVVPNVPNTIFQARHSHFPEEKRSSSVGVKVQNLDFSPSRFDNVRSELPCISGTISSLSDQVMIKSPSSEMTLRPYGEQYSEPMTSPMVEKSVAARSMLCSSGENFDWETNLQTQGITVSKVQDNIMSFDNQTFKDSESVTHSSSLPHSADLLHLPNHSRSHSLQHNEPFSAVSLNSDPLYGDNRVSYHMLRHAPGDSVKSNGYYENLASNFPGVDRSTNHAIWHSNEGEGKHMKTDYCGNGTLDVGESSIISNILSLDLDSWDDSLASPQNLVKLLGDTNKQHSTLKMSSSWKPQNNSQSRFSFARHGESRSQASDDLAFGVFGQLQKTSSFSHDFGDNRNSYFDKPALGNGFSSSLQEPEIYSPNPLAFSSNRSSAVPRAQISAPPGFSVPNRAPPPGFSSHERMDHTFDNLAGNHLPDSSFLLRNSFQPQPSGNVGGTTDIEFMDPAILAVGKGRPQAGLNNPVIDMRSQSHFPQQLSALENEARFQLLMQRSLSAHQNLRYTDVGDRFSSISDSYGLSSRLVDQSPVSNLNSFSQLALQQQSRNGLVSNGQWDGWNEVQGGNNLGMADLIRNERLGFNKFYASGYEDSKFRMPTSSDLYNRTFEM